MRKNCHFRSVKISWWKTSIYRQLENQSMGKYDVKKEKSNANIVIAFNMISHSKYTMRHMDALAKRKRYTRTQAHTHAHTYIYKEVWNFLSMIVIVLIRYDTIRADTYSCLFVNFVRSMPCWLACLLACLFARSLTFTLIYKACSLNHSHALHGLSHSLSHSLSRSLLGECRKTIETSHTYKCLYYVPTIFIRSIYIYVVMLALNLYCKLWCDAFL